MQTVGAQGRPTQVLLDKTDDAALLVVGADGHVGRVVKIPAFLNARRDGAVLPILHVNDYKTLPATDACRPHSGPRR